MRSVLYILLIYLNFQRIISWMSRFGLILFILSTPAALVNAQLAHGALTLAFIFVFVFPYLFTPMIHRELISNRHLALVPGFHIRAGMTLFIYTVLLALTLPCISAIHGANAVTPWRVLAVFTAASAYSGFYGSILPSRYVLLFGTIVPLGLFVLVVQYKPLINAVVLDPRFLGTAFAISVLGWIYGLMVLAMKNYFRPVYASTPLISGKPDVISTNAFTPNLGWLSRWQIGPYQSAAGTLLSGCPDGMLNRIKRVLDTIVIAPLLVCLFILFMWGIKFPSQPVAISSFFLLFSLLTSIMFSLDYGELAARGRLLWLRYGGDRQWQWRFMEKYILTTLGINVLIALVISTAFLLLTDVPSIKLLYYFTMIICGVFFCCYLSLACRIHNWSNVAIAITIIIFFSFLVTVSTIILLGPAPDTGILVSNPLRFVSMPGGLILLSLALRAYARRGFTGVDWFIVKPRQVPRYQARSWSR